MPDISQPIPKWRGYLAANTGGTHSWRQCTGAGPLFSFLPTRPLACQTADWWPALVKRGRIQCWSTHVVVCAVELHPRWAAPRHLYSGHSHSNENTWWLQFHIQPVSEFPGSVGFLENKQPQPKWWGPVESDNQRQQGQYVRPLFAQTEPDPCLQVS